jgi:hypothetical protein
MKDTKIFHSSPRQSVGLGGVGYSTRSNLQLKPLSKRCDGVNILSRFGIFIDAIDLFKDSEYYTVC